MPVDAKQLARRLRRLYPASAVRAALASPVLSVEHSLHKYRDDPIGFAREVLGVEPTEDQKQIIQALPGRVKIESGHSTGKSWLMAVICLWWFYSREPSVVICNAPKLEHLQDVLWSEIRMLWMRAKRPLPNYFVGPKAPEMFHHPDHWAKGFTTSKGEAYQGRHRENMLFIFDEDEGIESIYWTATSTMYQPDHAHGWIASCNPITTSSQSYRESMLTEPDGVTPKWKLFRLSSLSHPNIIAELAGRTAPIPNAVSMGQVAGWVKDWTTRLSRAEDRVSSDIEWPPGSGLWYRPGPVFKARVQGIRPTEGVDTVWSAATFAAACTSRWDARICWEMNSGITIGVDASGYGDDDTCFHARCGPLSVYHEAANGWGPEKAAAHLKMLCNEMATWYNAQAQFERPILKPQDIRVTLEFDGGYGVGVHSHRADYHNWSGITVGSQSMVLSPDGRPAYKNLRSQLWFEACKAAEQGKMDLSRLSKETLEKLRMQLLTPYFEVLPDGTRFVEPKKEFKERMGGKSPDDADGLNLSYFTPIQRWPTVITRGEDD